MPRFSRPRRRRRDQESFSLRPRWIRRDFSDQSGYGPHQGGYGATFQTKAETTQPRINFSRPRRRIRVFPDQGGYGATFHTRVETVSLSRPKRRRRDFPYQGADGIIFQTEAETARPRKFFFATAVDTARL